MVAMFDNLRYSVALCCSSWLALRTWGGGRGEGGGGRGGGERGGGEGGGERGGGGGGGGKGHHMSELFKQCDMVTGVT